MITPHAGGCRLWIRVTPKSSRDEIKGITVLPDGREALGVTVRAVPEKGKANKAMIALLAKILRVAASSIHVVSGTTARIKLVQIDGADNALFALIGEMRNKHAE